MQPTVFVTMQPKPNRTGWQPNLTPATAHGRIVFVFSGDDKPWCNPDWAMEHAQQVLKDFNPDEDSILWPNSGDPFATYVVTAVLSRFPIDKIRVLYWERNLVDGVRDRQNGFYTPITLRLPL